MNIYFILLCIFGFFVYLFLGYLNSVFGYIMYCYIYDLSFTLQEAIENDTNDFYSPFYLLYKIIGYLIPFVLIIFSVVFLFVMLFKKILKIKKIKELLEKEFNKD